MKRTLMPEMGEEETEAMGAGEHDEHGADLDAD